MPELQSIDLGAATEKAVRALDALPADDPERSHKDAETILCDLLRELGIGEVADAFIGARKRCRFWYS